MEITYLRGQGICCISQQTYIDKLAKHFFLVGNDTHFPAYPATPMEVNIHNKLIQAMDKLNFEGPYRSIVGGLLYSFVCTRVDIGFSVSILIRHLSNPKPTHFMMAKHVLFYLQGTKSFGLLLGGEVIPHY